MDRELLQTAEKYSRQQRRKSLWKKTMGILGGAVGRKINRRIDNATVDKLFLGLLTVIMLVCCYNFYQYC